MFIKKAINSFAVSFECESKHLLINPKATNLKEKIIMIRKEILGANRFEHPSKKRIGSRGIIIKDSQILLVHELKTDFYMIGNCKRRLDM